MSSNQYFNEAELHIVSKAEQYCAQNEQCRSAVRDKLYAWGADRDLTEKIVNYLVEKNFIDEARYCRLYCESKLHLQKWGRIKIAYQLRAKRIDTKVIEETIQNIDPEVYNQTLTDLATTKAATINDTDPRKRQTKLFNYLSSHGFEAEEIRQAIKDL